jgi:uncharacterized RDD family membrane protein YckC
MGLKKIPHRFFQNLRHGDLKESFMEMAAAGYKKADMLKRFLAFLIDGFIAFVLVIVPYVGWIASFAYDLFKDGMGFNFMDHRSIGKKLMKLKVVVLNKENGLADPAVSAKRNFLFVIPVIGFFALIVEGIKVLSDAKGIRFGDQIAKTMVIDEVHSASVVDAEKSAEQAIK